MLLYKYNILERVIVENIIPKNVIINRGAAEVDNHISRDDFFDYHPLKNGYIYFIIPNIIPYFFYPFSSDHGAGSSTDSTIATTG